MEIIQLLRCYLQFKHSAFKKVIVKSDRDDILCKLQRECKLGHQHAQSVFKIGYACGILEDTIGLIWSNSQVWAQLRAFLLFVNGQQQ